MDANDSREILMPDHVGDAAAPAAPTILDAPAGTPPPRLGIIHLLAWLTVASALLGTERSVQILEKAASHPDKFTAHYLVLDSIRVVALAAGVVGLAALVRWRSNGRALPLAPGHWILAAEGTALLATYLVQIVQRVIVAILDNPNDRISYLPAFGLLALIAAAQMFMFALAVSRCAEKGSWQVILGILAIAAAAKMTLDVILFLIFGEWLRPPFPLFEFYYPAPAVVAGLAAGPALIYTVYDAFRFRRDWLHGLGVTLVLVNGLTWVGYWVASGWYP